MSKKTESKAVPLSKDIKLLVLINLVFLVSAAVFGLLGAAVTFAAG
ncbi:hypothetical protein NI17_013680 [Thermobifida halotolerans]|uniref:Uncharacterized protein n=1 Tax=Thermobifida halotolerans TaxID=483545 RepID=A0AA97LTR7_9ACTN|nr:hypothetical protein [Thermobifida halotolerans]UOE17917.1 hypothetical protein NI17_013680 [Thermobifida halotolerans]